MTTNDAIEVKEPRPLGELMQLGTYQGMTDEEIEIVFKSRLDKEMHDRLDKVQVNNMIERGNMLQAAYEQMIKDTEETSARISSEIANMKLIVQQSAIAPVTVAESQAIDFGGDSVG